MAKGDLALILGQKRCARGKTGRLQIKPALQVTGATGLSVLKLEQFAQPVWLSG